MKPDILNVNGKKFARTPAAFDASLFNPSGTCTGFYSPRKYGVLLTDHTHAPRVFVVNNRHGERFMVTAHRFEGRTRYMFAVADSDKRWLGIDSLSYREERELAVNVIKQLADTTQKDAQS